MTTQTPDTTIKDKTMKVKEEIKPTNDGARSERQFPDAMPRPWTAEVGDRLYGGGDCWVIDCEIGSVAEMQCGIDREGPSAKLIVTAVNSYDALREAATEALRYIKCDPVLDDDGIAVIKQLDAALALVDTTNEAQS